MAACRTAWIAADPAPGNIVVAAGLWRATAAWGPASTMVMTEACAGSEAEQAQPGHLHDRMPVILPQSDWTDWLDGAPDAAGLLCRPFPGMVVTERTGERWGGLSGARP